MNRDQKSQAQQHQPTPRLMIFLFFINTIKHSPLLSFLPSLLTFLLPPPIPIANFLSFFFPPPILNKLFSFPLLFPKPLFPKPKTPFLLSLNPNPFSPKPKPLTPFLPRRENHQGKKRRRRGAVELIDYSYSIVAPSIGPHAGNDYGIYVKYLRENSLWANKKTLLCL